jgi:outer membrane protein
VTNRVWRAPLLALGFAVLAFGQAGSGPTRVATLNIRDAIIQTKDGQKAAQEITQKFDPRRKEFDKRQQELQQLEDQYRKGANTMAEEARTQLMRDIDVKRKSLTRDMDDAQAELEQEQGRLYQELGQKMMAVIDKYATDRGYALILDISSPQTPVLYASNTIDITRDIIALYDQGAAAQAPVAPGAAAPKPSAPPAATPKPTSPPKK